VFNLIYATKLFWIRYRWDYDSAANKMKDHGHYDRGSDSLLGGWGFRLHCHVQNGGSGTRPVLTRVLRRPEHSLLVIYNPNLISRGSSVGIATGYGVEERNSGFDSRRGLGIFLFAIVSRTALRPTQPPIQWIPGVKRPGLETNHSLSSSAEVRNTWLYTSTPQYVFMAWVLVKHRDNFILYVNN
jgi:hypothetical protein